METDRSSVHGGADHRRGGAGALREGQELEYCVRCGAHKESVLSGAVAKTAAVLNNSATVGFSKGSSGGTGAGGRRRGGGAKQGQRRPGNLGRSTSRVLPKDARGATIVRE